jgi:hypothetical protein
MGFYLLFSPYCNLRPLPSPPPDFRFNPIPFPNWVSSGSGVVPAGFLQRPKFLPVRGPLASGPVWFICGMVLKLIFTKVQHILPL